MGGHAIRDFAQKRLFLIEDLAFTIINFVRRYGVFINSIRHSGQASAIGAAILVSAARSAGKTGRRALAPRLGELVLRRASAGVTIIVLHRATVGWYVNRGLLINTGRCHSLPNRATRYLWDKGDGEE